MSASSGWDNLPTAPEPGLPSRDASGEPVGYALGVPPLYEQPPNPHPLPYLAKGPVVPSEGMSTTGFVLSISGIALDFFVPILTFPLAVAGLIVSAIALRRCRLGLAAGRGLAIAGIVVGGIGIVVDVAMVLILALALGSMGP